MRTSGSICTKKALLLLLLAHLCTMSIWAQYSKYRNEVIAPPARFLNGIAVGVDGVGFGMKFAGARYANMEVFGRINLLEKYFPVVELGVGECEREGEEQTTVFKTRAPYFRVGADYCLTKKRNGNRLMLGARYGYSNYNYDYSNPDFIDPYWGTNSGQKGTHVTDIPGTQHWMEICLGIETKLWKFIRMGWSFRYKSRLSQNVSPHGEAWYVPGYGKNGGTCMGGTVHLAFEIQPKAKKTTDDRLKTKN